MPSILIHVSSELKKKLEQHPDYRYGNCKHYYCSILQRWTESPEFQLDIATSTIEHLENRIQWLQRQAEMFRKLWTAAGTAAPAGMGQDQAAPKNRDAA